LPLVEEAGYEGCLSGFGGLIGPGGDRHLLPRVPVPPFCSVLNLELHLSGCLNWFYALKRRLGLQPQLETPETRAPAGPWPETVPRSLAQVNDRCF
jgi:hypothetical protein